MRTLVLATTAVIGTGGVAYAAGMVPAFISEEFEWISPAEVHGERRVASFNVSAGDRVRTFQVWRADNDQGETCTVTVEAQGRFGPSFDGACAQDPALGWFGWTAESSKITEPMPAATLYVYGEPADSAVRQMRVHGESFTNTADVDPVTGGYVVAVPEVTSTSHIERAGQVVATVSFLDETGQQLDSHTVRNR